VVVVADALEEVEIHHVDLAGGYTFADAPSMVALRVLDRLATRRAAQACESTSLPMTRTGSHPIQQTTVCQ
jgi:hypothetical protein